MAFKKFVNGGNVRPALHIHLYILQGKDPNTYKARDPNTYSTSIFINMIQYLLIRFDQLTIRY